MILYLKEIIQFQRLTNYFQINHITYQKNDLHIT
jgi:hypothetical protein